MEAVDSRGKEPGMIRYAVLGSGSNANSYIFTSGEVSFIVDNGFSCRECLRRMDELGFDPDSVRYIFVTHIHSDHIRGIKVLSKKLKVPVVTHRECKIDSHVKGGVYKKLPVVEGETSRFDGIEVTPFLTSHDVPFPLGYFFALEDTTFAIITDTGEITEDIYSYARQAEVLFLEANYDEEMLKNGPYPEDLKKRIASREGHLSNTDAIKLMNRLHNDGTSRVDRVYFCHLSKNNNSPEILQEHLNSLMEWDREYTICPRGEMCSGIEHLSLEKDYR